MKPWRCPGCNRRFPSLEALITHQDRDGCGIVDIGPSHAREDHVTITLR